MEWNTGQLRLWRIDAEGLVKPLPFSTCGLELWKELPQARWYGRTGWYGGCVRFVSAIPNPHWRITNGSTFGVIDLEKAKSNPPRLDDVVIILHNLRRTLWRFPAVTARGPDELASVVLEQLYNCDVWIKTGKV